MIDHDDAADDLTVRTGGAPPLPHAPGPWGGVKVKRSLYRRVVFRRLFYLQLLKIAITRRRASDKTGRIFISKMGGIGDLIYLFPTLEKLRTRYVIDMGTAGYPYLELMKHNLNIAHIYTPFIYKPLREAHRRLIERVLSPYYEKVLLLDFLTLTADWWKQGKHLGQIYADACNCATPAKGVLYLSEEHRQRAAEYLAGHGLHAFVYVAQMVRHRLPYKSWPLSHYHALYHMLQDRVNLPIVVDTIGSDEREIPNFCLDAGRLDILTAAAVIQRTRLFIGSDSGLTHVAGALGTPTVAIHLGFPPEACATLGDRVALVRQRYPFDDPAETSPAEVFRVAEKLLRETG